MWGTFCKIQKKNLPKDKRENICSRFQTDKNLKRIQTTQLAENAVSRCLHSSYFFLSLGTPDLYLRKSKLGKKRRNLFIFSQKNNILMSLILVIQASLHRYPIHLVHKKHLFQVINKVSFCLLIDETDETMLGNVEP